MTNPQLSIIVPVYNAGEYLHSCIDSILNQSYREFELLLIDDGSIDDSGKICDEYASKDMRVRVIHQTNHGVSSARNVGLSIASGTWIYFPDADDIVMDGALKTMMDLANDDVDYVMCGYEHVDEVNKCTYAISDRKRRILGQQEAIVEMFAPTDYRYQGYLWNKLFRLSTIRKYSLVFDTNIKYNEDRLFNVAYLSHIRGNVAYSTEPVYRYTEHITSAMASLTQRFTPSFLTDLDALAEMGRSLKSIHVNKDTMQAFYKWVYYSRRRYYRMCQQFNEYTWRQICEVEIRVLRCVGFRKYVSNRVNVLIDKFHRGDE